LRKRMGETDLLESGIYTVPDAAELVEAPAQLVGIWVGGHKGKQEPVIINDLGRVQGKVAVSFHNLMELRFVALFHNAGVRLQHIRAIMGEVRRSLDHSHPFATEIIFRTDGKRIVAEIGRKNGIKNIYDLRSRNYEMHPVVMKSLKNDVIYDPRGDATAWRPRRKIAPNVVVHPAFSFGRPILQHSHIPTATIAAAAKAEKSAKAAAWLYEVTEKDVREAIKFEKALHKAA
jgi:uncharacterized protein (DUF433 family)